MVKTRKTHGLPGKTHGKKLGKPIVYLGKPMVKTRKTHGLPGKTYGKNSENPWFTWENTW